MAATVSMQPGELVYTASLGEAKRLTITEGPRLIVVSDPGAPVIPGHGCTSVDAHTAHCVPPDPQEQFPVERFGIDVRDGDDRVALGRGSVLTPFVVVLRAGNGDDRVAGCRSTVFADMGRGADRLSLCAVAAATVRGGPGPDLLRGGPDGFERLAGGDGNDVLVGGAGQDVLLGGAGADRLLGGEGDDLLRGGEGSDALMDANGRDRLLGGPIATGSARGIGSPTITLQAEPRSTFASPTRATGGPAAGIRSWHRITDGYRCSCTT